MKHNNGIRGATVTKLAYTFKNDVLFKMIFRQYQNLLKRLVSLILRIRLEDITAFLLTNPEISAEVVGEKFCRLDINMTVNGQRVDLEIQVADEGDYPERALYYWAREYSSALGSGGEYRDLPRTIVISIVAFKMFPCVEYYSEHRLLEVTRHTPLTDKAVLIFFELPKLPEVVNNEDELKLWLALFNADTEEDLAKIEALEVSVMTEAIGAYRRVSTTDEFKEIERLRSRARHNEASALGHARREGRAEGEQIGEKRSDERWQVVVADKDAENERLRRKLAEYQAMFAKDK